MILNILKYLKDILYKLNSSLSCNTINFDYNPKLNLFSEKYLKDIIFYYNKELDLYTIAPLNKQLNKELTNDKLKILEYIKNINNKLKSKNIKTLKH